MGPKKKKKGKKKKEKKEGDEDEKKLNLPAAFDMVLPVFNWIRIEFRLCDAPTPEHNKFLVVMRSSDRILELKKRIVEYHGRVNDVKIYNYDPIPERGEDKMRMDKPRVPPFRDNARLRALYAEKCERDERAELRNKKRQMMIDKGEKSIQEIDAELSDEPEPEVIKSDDPFSKAKPVDKYEELKNWDFPTHPTQKTDIFEYDENTLSLYDIFGEYGTALKPKACYECDDPKPPPPKEKVVVKPPTPKAPKEDEDDDPDAADEKEGDGEPVVEEEPEEEIFYPPVHRILYYDFSTYKNDILKKEDPILLALMVKGELD